MPSERARAVILTAKALSLPPRCSPSAVAMSLAERVTSERMASLTVIVRPAGTPSFDGGCDGGVFRHGDSRIERDPTRLQRLEDEVERHHLGERGGVGLGVGVARVEDLAGLGVDHDRGLGDGERFAGRERRKRGDRRGLEPGKSKIPKRLQSLPDHVQLRTCRPDTPAGVPCPLHRTAYATHQARPRHDGRWRRVLPSPLTANPGPHRGAVPMHAALPASFGQYGGEVTNP